MKDLFLLQKRKLFMYKKYYIQYDENQVLVFLLSKTVLTHKGGLH